MERARPCPLDHAAGCRIRRNPLGGTGQGLCQQFDPELGARWRARDGRKRADRKVGSEAVHRRTGSLNYQGQAGTRITTGSFGISLQQTLFDGFQTVNNVRAAEARVRASVQSLRNTEQNILFDAASAYMDVIRDRQIAALTDQNLAFLSEQLRAAQSRFDVGEGTRTDVAQAQASRALAVAQVSAARAQAQSSAAIYRQVIGEEPRKLQSGKPVSQALPRSLDQAEAIALSEHPAIVATQHLVDAASFSVKSAEGQLLPQISAGASATTGFRDTQITGLPGVGLGGGGGGFDKTDTASVGLTLTVPIYSGGRTSAQIRQSKESLGQARIDVDVNRDQVRAALTSALAQYNAARESLAANRQSVDAARQALNGVVEERNVGQRTTLDVLNAQADLITVQINQVSAERDLVGRKLCDPIGGGASERKAARPERCGTQAARTLQCGPQQVGRYAHARRSLTAAISDAMLVRRRESRYPVIAKAQATITCEKGHKPRLGGFSPDPGSATLSP